MTIYDIARSCNVSIATVSRVLNGSTKVSPKTREKVLAAINEQNYTPNPFARGLGLNSMKMIGILCTDVSDAFFAKAVSLVEHDLRKRGLDVILGCTGNELADKQKYLQFMLDKHVDAIILIGSPFHEMHDHSHLLEEAALETPIITINSLIAAPNIYCVLCDEKEAVLKAVERLHQAGYSKILYLYDILTFGGRQKLTGYRDGLEKCSITFSDDLVQQVSRSIEGAAEVTEKLLKNNVDFDAVITAEDLFAVGCQKELTKHGISMPVIGFNNSILAECTTPGLTSIDNRIDVLCPTAVDILSKVLNGEADMVPSKTLFPSVLVERDSFKTV